MSALTISELNALDLSAFVAHLGNLVEYFPVLAAALYQRRPFATREELVACAHEIVDALPIDGECQVNIERDIGYLADQIKFSSWARWPSFQG